MATPVKIKAIVTKATRHTSDVASYEFAPQGRVPKFQPGQFLHLSLDEYKPNAPWPESRVFSIASSQAERRERLAITVSVKGHYTRRIYEGLHEGRACWLKLPYGEFFFDRDCPLVLVAGGVGITPFLPLLHKLLEEKSAQHIQLHYGVRSSSLYLFGALLQRCREELPNFSMTTSSEDGTLPGRSGLLDIDVIHAAAPAGALFYLSGPPRMIQSFQDHLSDYGVDSKNIRLDDWE